MIWICFGIVDIVKILGRLHQTIVLQFLNIPRIYGTFENNGVLLSKRYMLYKWEKHSDNGISDLCFEVFT